MWQPRDTDLGLLVSRAAREDVSVVSSHPSVALSLATPELIAFSRPVGSEPGHLSWSPTKEFRGKLCAPIGVTADDVSLMVF